MAALVCYATGAMEVLLNVDVPEEDGPITLATGTAGRMRNLMTGYGVYIDKFKNWYVPGTPSVKRVGRSDEDIVNEIFNIVVLFRAKINYKKVK